MSTSVPTASSNATHIVLNCAFLGPTIEQVFPVEIALDARVLDLKQAIMQRNRDYLLALGMSRLQLWQVRDSPDLSINQGGSYIYSQLNKPLSTDRIKLKLGDLSLYSEIEDAVNLSTMHKVSDYFPPHSNLEGLHLVVQFIGGQFEAHLRGVADHHWTPI